MALPIRELETFVSDEAKPKTETVIQVTRSSAEGFAVLCKVIAETATLKLVFWHLARRQERLINRLVERQFDAYEETAFGDLANAIDSLVSSEQGMLRELSELGSEIRVWLPLRRLQAQIDHLDSIAESLHAETDPECMTLLSIAAEQVI